ncbi:hypothetical protein MPTK1_6g15920 [Marchantia polymorpha subsp. ruderalis]|uniref:Sphingomyelin synthase-like domain-containing protein n=2 Tax=Marchantia polymorpha TaxID=3197 RepID=A0AAF6BSI8_MARPO|nr:hypothetical protein MARPO_0056s0104 [Marchantia polymorpha]BBN14972.1 hypothetical protein Mp_6g15920 [Marchantia polymorpha subsp. ruderalis]|eukprot:PTQ37657.1 hypothetical protein MARPO_0056s0104 [Marchantia polymorpha]
MPPYVAREASKVPFYKTFYEIYRRIVMETIVEWPLLLEKWRFLLFGLVFQYFHGVAARIAHYLHRPGPILHDLGFDLLPELGPEKAWISETVFTFIFTTFVLWTFHPFVFNNKRFYTVYLWYRVLAMLVIAQTMRIVSFLVTQLPGPNYHCREGSAAATLDPPKHISEVLLLNFPYGVIYGCGDLIFSSHMTFALTFVHTYARYGSKTWIKRAAWVLVVVQSLLIVASRKHYTVDVVIAWFVVILLFNYVGRKFYDPELMDRSPLRDQILPMNRKDGRNKDEMQKMVNGNSGYAGGDGRQRTPTNGKILDDERSPKTLEVLVNGSL